MSLYSSSNICVSFSNSVPLFSKILPVSELFSGLAAGGTPIVFVAWA
jgi:hypothetical protein